jgi:hypothetical protein
VIPTALLVGLVVGWVWVVPVVGLAWAVLLMVTGTIGAQGIPTAVALGAANAGVGLIVHRGMLRVARRARIVRC